MPTGGHIMIDTPQAPPGPRRKRGSRANPRATDILDRIREHTQKAPPRKERFDLNAATSEVIGLARNAITKNNLTVNAVAAMGSIEAKPRALLIRTAQEHGSVVVAVRDSGPGNDPAHQERGFETCHSANSSEARMVLSICRSIIHAHGRPPVVRGEQSSRLDISAHASRLERRNLHRAKEVPMAASAALRSVADIESFMIEYYAAWGGIDEDRIMSYYADNVTIQIPGSLMQGNMAVRE